MKIWQKVAEQINDLISFLTVNGVNIVKGEVLIRSDAILKAYNVKY